MSSTSSKALTVVVADDEPAMLSLVASHMKRLGFTVHEAPDGGAAWKLVQHHVPDLVMLDVMMPEMSGWEVARAIKAKSGPGGVFEHTPVLMLTGIGERLNAMNSPLFAADAWLDKPFQFTTLDEKIAEALGKHGKKIPAPSATGEADKPAKAAKKSAAKEAPAKKVAASKPSLKATKPAPVKPAAPAKPAAKKAAPAKAVAPAKPVAPPAKKAAPAKAVAPAKKAAPAKAASKPATKSASKTPVKAAAKSSAKKSTRRA